MRRQPRAGMALVLALIALLIIEALTTGIVVLASHARGVADAQVRHARAESAADAAVAFALMAWPQKGYDTIAVGRTIPIAAPSGEPDVVIDVSIERVSAAVSVVRASATVGLAPAVSGARSVALARTLDRAALVAESNAALTSTGRVVVAGSSRVTAAATALPPAWSDTVCPGTDPLPLPAAVTTATPAVVGDDASVYGAVVIDTTLVADSVALGGVKWSELETIADRTEAGSLTPAPRDSAGACMPFAAANWGDPLHPDGACAGYFPLIVARGDFTMAGGYGQGILAVEGVLTITAGATFVGLIVARDGITIEPGSRAFGALRSRHGDALIDGADINYSRCAVARAAASTPSSHRVILSQRRYIPSF